MTYKPGGGGESGRIITADRERHIRADERDKVLDELEQWIKDRYTLDETYSFSAKILNQIIATITELHKRASPYTNERYGDRCGLIIPCKECITGKESAKAEREKVLDEAIAVCQKHYEERYSLSMREHIDGYDDDDLKDVKYLYWQRACGASECASKLQELRKQGEH